MRRLKNKDGFTLLEVLLVISLLGIILAITVPNVAKGSEKANEELCNSTKLIITAAIEQYETFSGTFPTEERGEDKLVSFLVDEQYLKHELTCPSNGKFSYSEGEVVCDVHHIENND